MKEEKGNDLKRFEKSNVTVSVTSGAFPLGLFRQWEEDCIKRFGNCRWMKMWHDHMASQELDIFRMLIDDIDALKRRIELLEKKPRRKEKITLGGIEEEV